MNKGNGTIIFVKKGILLSINIYSFDLSEIDDFYNYLMRNKDREHIIMGEFNISILRNNLDSTKFLRN